MAEFTGERVIPGLVDADLFNEHLARYRFAARFANGASVLDAGCGSGYGTAELTGARSITALDIATEALVYAKSHVARPDVRFVRGSCEVLPFADASFDLLAAFEVIEHLERWSEFLRDAKRVLKPEGILLVSTPNKSYYAEMRHQAGPNPFHCHEFEYAEFQDVLNRVFPHVRMWSQNHANAIVFAPRSPAATDLEAGGDSTPENAHFFIAACSQSPLPESRLFAWLPSTSNVLREREHHIAKLEALLEELKSAHTLLHDAHNETLRDLRERSLWAQQQDARVREVEQRIETLQTEHEERLVWVRSLEQDLSNALAEITRLRSRELELETTVVERTEWALARESALKQQTQELQARLGDLALAKHKLAVAAQSKWVRLGRSLNVGPAIDPEGSPESADQ